jgi:thiol reductant ABC exporter CydD subunit
MAASPAADADERTSRRGDASADRRLLAADRRLLVAAGVARTAIAGAIGLGLATAALALAQAWLIAHTIAGAFDGGLTLEALSASLALLAVVLAVRAALGWAGETVAVRISSRVKSALRRRVVATAVALGPRWASEARSGALVLLATRGLDALDGYFARYLPQVGLAVVVPAAVIIALAFVDRVAALTVLLTVPLIPVFMVLIGRASEAQRRRRWTTLSRLAGRFLDVVAGAATLRAYGRADAQVAALRRTTDAYRRETMATLRVAFLSALALELLSTISVALVAVGVGLRLVEGGGMTLETGLFAIIVTPEAYLPLRRLGAEFHASEEGRAAADSAFAVLDEAPPRTGGRTDVPSLDGGRLVIEGLSVRAPGRDALAPFEVSLAVSPGEIVGVTGPSGSGKSTLLAALLGLVPPTAGTVVVVDRTGTGTPIETLDGGAWRQTIAWLPQRPFIVAGTVAEAVRFGAADVADETVRAALVRVGLGSLPLDRQLGEAGAGLSSGERRRLGLARVLVRGAPLLLLDEPTAGLDVEAEATILAAIRTEAERGAAVLLVAHRPAAAAAADRVVAVEWRAEATS